MMSITFVSVSAGNICEWMQVSVLNSIQSNDMLFSIIFYLPRQKIFNAITISSFKLCLFFCVLCRTVKGTHTGSTSLVFMSWTFLLLTEDAVHGVVYLFLLFSCESFFVPWPVGLALYGADTKYRLSCIDPIISFFRVSILLKVRLQMKLSEYEPGLLINLQDILKILSVELMLGIGNIHSTT